MAAEPADWGPKFEAAYERLPSNTRKSAQITMLSVYAAVGEYEKAEKFLSLRDLETPRDLALAMDTLLALGRLNDAASVARQCSVLLNDRLEASEASHLLRAMATYFERSGEWEGALRAWEMIPAGGPLSDAALVSRVEIHLAKALVAAREGIAGLASLKSRLDANTISFPGQHEAMIKSADRKLQKLNRSIENLLSHDRRKELGVNGIG